MIVVRERDGASFGFNKLGVSQMPTANTNFKQMVTLSSPPLPFLKDNIYDSLNWNEYSV